MGGSLVPKRVTTLLTEKFLELRSSVKPAREEKIVPKSVTPMNTLKTTK